MKLTAGRHMQKLLNIFRQQIIQADNGEQNPDAFPFADKRTSGTSLEITSLTNCNFTKQLCTLIITHYF